MRTTWSESPLYTQIKKHRTQVLSSIESQIVNSGIKKQTSTVFRAGGRTPRNLPERILFLPTLKNAIGALQEYPAFHDVKSIGRLCHRIRIFRPDTKSKQLSKQNHFGAYSLPTNQTGPPVMKKPPDKEFVRRYQSHLHCQRERIYLESHEALHRSLNRRPNHGVVNLTVVFREYAFYCAKMMQTTA